MMKFKHLFSNRNLAEMILKKWDFDQEKINLLDYFRISANAVYPFELKGYRNYLRFSPTEEKSREMLIAEIDFLNHLSESGYPVVKLILSKNNNHHEMVNTPWGDYISVAFKGVPGKQLSELGLTEELIYGWGKALGELHKQSNNYNPQGAKRPNYLQQLNWMEEVLGNYQGQEQAKKEVNILREFFLQLPQTQGNFGLIHYDFECDNVFYDEETKNFYPIDFDDSVYHWYVMDVVQSLNSMKDEISQEKYEDGKNTFLAGYTKNAPIEESMLKLFPIFQRYGNLYGYVRCLRSIEEKWQNEPEWMEDLRKHIDRSMKARSIDFGKPIK